MPVVDGLPGHRIDRTGKTTRISREDLADNASATVQIDVNKLTSSSLLPAQWSVSGHVYDLDTGLVSTVVPTNAAESGHVAAKEA